MQVSRDQHASNLSLNSPYLHPNASFVPANWSDAVKKVLESTHLNSTSFLELLSRNPHLKECYAKEAGVAEGYTVAEHTKLVLDKALEFRECLVENVSSIVSWGEFLLFLALHDSGKGIAHEKQSIVFGSSISFKEEELKTTKKF